MTNSVSDGASFDLQEIGLYFGTPVNQVNNRDSFEFLENLVVDQLIAVGIGENLGDLDLRMIR